MKQSAFLVSCLLLAGCSSLPAGQIPHVGQTAASQPVSPRAIAHPLSAEADPESSILARTYTQQELLSGGLSPDLRHMVSSAHERILQPDFAQAFAAGKNSFSTQTFGDFSILGACQCPLDNKMYAIGGYTLDTTNGLNHLYEYNPSTNVMTDIGNTGNIPSAAVAKHPFTGEIYYLESYNSPRRLYKYNRTTSTRTLIGSTNFPGNVVQLSFSNSGLLYAFTEAGQLHEISLSTATPTLIPLTGSLGSTGGDIATYSDDNLIYRVDRNGDLFKFDLALGTSTTLGSISGMGGSDVPAGLGFNPNGELLVLTYDAGAGNNRLYKINLASMAGTLLQTYTNATLPNLYPLADLASAHLYSCPSSSAGRPTSPTMLISDNFASMASNFANLPGETNPDTLSGWRQWNADYYPAGKGVVVYNPGRYNPATGSIDDPANDILGKRSTPGEYEASRPHLLETAIARTVPLRYSTGDKLKAKLMVAPTFSHNDSDATLMICFDDPAQTVAVSSTLRGNKVKSSELYVETVIPACATKATVIVMGYLGQNEDSSVTYEKASLEFIPNGYYTQTRLMSDNFDTATTHASYGANFPANMDEQFGPYDLYLVNNYPAVSGDKAVSAGNPTAASGTYGGLVKRVNLPSYTSSDRLSAKMFTATTFSDASSEASLLMDFFNSSNVKLGTVNAQTVNASQYRWIEIDRAQIPSGASYVKVVPIMKYGASEAASFLWNDLSLELVGLTPPPAPTSLVLNSPASGASFNLGDSISLSASPNLIVGSMSVKFFDGASLIGTGVQQGDGSFTASWSSAASGSHSISAQAQDAGGAVLVSSSANPITVTTPAATLTAPAAGWSVRNTGSNSGATLNLSASTANLPSGASVRFVTRRISNGTEYIIPASGSGNSYTGSWNAKNANATADSYSARAEILNSLGTVIATSALVSGTVSN